MGDIRELVKQVLEKGYLISLATVDDDGVWVADVIYVFDETFDIYWMSQENARHSQALLKNSQVAGAITVTTKPQEDDIGLQLEGRAEKIEGDIWEIAIKHRLKRGKPAPIKEGEALDAGESWYKLKPARIELIYQSKFGFERKSLSLVTYHTLRV